jgi:hypothetical protein
MTDLPGLAVHGLTGQDPIGLEDFAKLPQL